MFVLQKELARQALAKGICRERHDELSATADRDAMLEMFLRDIDFCLSNGFPANSFLKEHFGGVAEMHGVFVDNRGFARSNPPKCVCLGVTRGTVTVDGYNVSEIFLKDESSVTLFAGGHSFVRVDIFGGASLTVNAGDRAKVLVNRYGGSVGVVKSASATVKVSEKHRKTY